MRLCRICGERPVPESRIRQRDYRCYPCFGRQNHAVRRAWRQSPNGRALSQRTNARRIMVGREYHSSVGDAETAARINAHIKGRIHAFVEGQQDREKTEGAPKG